MPTTRILPALAILAATAGTLGADGPRPPAGSFRSLEELDAACDRQSADLDRRRMADLADLAARADGAGSAAAYARLFHLAIGRNLLAEAGPAADRCLAAPSSPREVRSLATLVRIGAAADRGDESGALAALKPFLADRARGASPADLDAAYAVAGDYVGRQIAARRFDAARSACEFARTLDGAPDAFKAHFGSLMARLDRVGKPAPPIAGVDVDGNRASLGGLAGRVVLVDFWATWCPPCIDEIPRLKALSEKYGAGDFVVLGVNVDAMHRDARDVESARPAVRRFLVDHGVRWTNLMNDEGEGDAVKAYGIEDIPARFLIGRDGKVVATDLAGEGLDRAIAAALGSGTASPLK